MNLISTNEPHAETGEEDLDWVSKIEVVKALLGPIDDASPEDHPALDEDDLVILSRLNRGVDIAPATLAESKRYSSADTAMRERMFSVEIERANRALAKEAGACPTSWRKSLLKMILDTDFLTAENVMDTYLDMERYLWREVELIKHILNCLVDHGIKTLSECDVMSLDAQYAYVLGALADLRSYAPSEVDELMELSMRQDIPAANRVRRLNGLAPL